MGLFVPYAPSVCRRVKKLKGERVGRHLYAGAAFWKLLPAQTEANNYANRSDTDAYARAIATTVVPGAAPGGLSRPAANCWFSAEPAGSRWRAFLFRMAEAAVGKSVCRT